MGPGTTGWPSCFAGCSMSCPRVPPGLAGIAGQDRISGGVRGCSPRLGYIVYCGESVLPDGTHRDSAQTGTAVLFQGTERKMAPRNHSKNWPETSYSEEIGWAHRKAPGCQSQKNRSLGYGGKGAWHGGTSDSKVEGCSSFSGLQ